MVINIRKLSIFLVLFNTLVVVKDLPLPVSGAVGGIIILSFVVTNQIARTFLKIALLIASMVLLKVLFKTYLVTEAGVSLVLILAALKLWELDSESDHFNMFLILALLECCLFLVNPTFITFFLGVVKVFVFFYFLLKIRDYDFKLLNGKRLFFLIAPSLALSLILFYTFPRFTQGFLTANNNRLLFSGSDSQLMFKKLGSLNLSSKIVFRVYGLDSHRFPFPLLYWRESVLWDYQKDEWRTGFLNLKTDQTVTPAPSVTYTVKLDQDYNEFLPVLDGLTHLKKSNHDYNFYSEYSFRLKNISRTPVSYEVETSFKESPKIFTPLMQRKGLKLKSDQKENIRKLVLGLQSEDSRLTDKEKLSLAIEFFKKQNYEYSLSPPAYNSLEEFIISGKSGYCSHFAAAFAYIARSAGLPSRIISGYQGGEFNPFDQSLIVREMDAHAWVEVYLKDSGWYKFDPTALVAPGRIEFGANRYHDKIEPYISLYYYKLPKSLLKFATFDRLSLWLDSLNSQFSTSILNFDKERQQQILNTFLPKSLSLGWIFAIALSSSLPLFWFFYSWLSNSKPNPIERRYGKFVVRMKREGIEKLPHESASAFRNRLLQTKTGLEDYINEETDHYIEFCYKARDLLK